MTSPVKRPKTALRSDAPRRGPKAEAGNGKAPSLPIWQGTGRGVYPTFPGKKKLSPSQKKILKTAERKRIRKWMEENLPRPGTPEWEALCTGCGKCCADKVWMGKNLVVLDTVCKYLERETNRCLCYETRFEREPLCMPIDAEIIMMGGLPEDCPYVANLPGYRGPIPASKVSDMC